MTRQDIINVAISIIETLRKEMVPRDTGNLADNALIYDIQGNMFIVTVDPNIAPYLPYTNEPWLSPKWNGKKNPNEGWWRKFTTEFAKRLAKQLGGQLRGNLK